MLTKPGRVADGKWVAHVTAHPSLCLCLLIALLGTLGAGCRLVQHLANAPGQAVHAVTPGRTANPAADTVEVQQRLMRFSDEYLVSMVYSMDKLRLGTNAID